ncbi:hypothetical protein OSTOST_19155, partial [Ostertagia ostertagi]
AQLLRRHRFQALGPLLPERTRNKVQLWTANSDWKNQIQKVAKPENIPAHWGGKLYDANGDGMCRDRLSIPFDPIPHELYWEPDERAPGLSELTCAVIPAGKAKTATYVLSTHEPTYIVVNRFCDRTFGMGIWYSDDVAAVDFSLNEMTVGDVSEAWVRSLTVYYRIRFENEKGELVDFKEI